MMTGLLALIILWKLISLLKKLVRVLRAKRRERKRRMQRELQLSPPIELSAEQVQERKRIEDERIQREAEEQQRERERILQREHELRNLMNQKDSVELAEQLRKYELDRPRDITPENKTKIRNRIKRIERRIWLKEAREGELASLKKLRDAYKSAPALTPPPDIDALTVWLDRFYVLNDLFFIKSEFSEGRPVYEGHFTPRQARNTLHLERGQLRTFAAQALDRFNPSPIMAAYVLAYVNNRELPGKDGVYEFLDELSRRTLDELASLVQEFRSNQAMREKFIIQKVQTVRQSAHAA